MSERSPVRRSSTSRRSQGAAPWALPLLLLFGFTSVCPAGAQRPTTAGGRHPEVIYANGLLTISASNSSLNSILREIAKETGMKITGGVAEDRVFGNYGPAAPTMILTTLLDGSGSNLMIVNNDQNQPTELILTPRQGTVTPPNPNATGFDDTGSDDDTPRPAFRGPGSGSGVSPTAQTPGPARTGPPVTGTAPGAAVGGVDGNPAATQPSNTTEQVVFPAVGPTSAPSSGSTTPLVPNTNAADGAKTPQQIFEQLQRLRQQQEQQPATQTTPQ